MRTLQPNRTKVRHVHDQHGVACGIGEQDVEGREIAVGIGVTPDVDGVGLRPGRRQDGIQLRHGFARKRSRGPAELGEAIDGEDAKAAAVGQDGEVLAVGRANMG